MVRPPAGDAEGAQGSGPDEREAHAMSDCDIERFIFPDGSERDMLVFEAGSEPVPGSESAPDTACPIATSAPAPREAHVCPLCGSPLVHPTDWQRTGAACWLVTLRCPNCETVRTITLIREEVERLNRALYEGTERLARQADQLVRHHFEEETAKFVAALDADLILPIDF
jgi:hypothetical protein